MKCSVLAQAFDRKTGQPVGNPRTEVIDTGSNLLFKEARFPLEVKAVYESFWNNLNDTSAEVVFVQSVTLPMYMQKRNQNGGAK